MKAHIGPRNLFSQQLHAVKYRQPTESFDDYCIRYARTTADDETHFRKLLERLRCQAILPAGRQQRSVGWAFQTTAFNCFVGDRMSDSMVGIMSSLTNAALTLRSGGGDGWNFSSLRPEGEPVRGLGYGAHASGPISFMGLWHAMCNTIMSAGERRGAMMGVLNVDHPDILKFVRCKRDNTTLSNFNISVGTSDAFMEAVENDKLYDLCFNGRIFNSVRALDVWSDIMSNTWDYAEPGILFLDTINRMNPLQYCEYIDATNPCGEQPLPPHGACLLLSHNIVKYIVPQYSMKQGYEIDLDRLAHDVKVSTRACDNVFENTIFPLEQQRNEAFSKRRMGIGATGMADALAVCGLRYGTPEYIEAQEAVLMVIRDATYNTSIELAREKGTFPMFDAEGWLNSGFAKTLPDEIRHGIKKHGLRNGLLLSIAPTGTISMAADNVSSGIEPSPAIESTRTVLMPDGPVEVDLNAWSFEEHGIRARTASETSPNEHVAVLCAAQKYVDSAISKTINLKGAKTTPAMAGETTFAEFKDIYMTAYRGGAKGCTTFNMHGMRAGIISERCTMDAETGERICG